MDNNSILIFKIGSKLKVLTKLIILRGKVFWIYTRIFVILFKMANVVTTNIYDSPCSPITGLVRYFLIYGGR